MQRRRNDGRTNAPIALRLTAGSEARKLSRMGRDENGKGRGFYKSLLENSFDGVAIVDAAGIITFQNPAAAFLLGAEVGELLGKNTMELVHPDDIAPALANLEALNAEAGVTLPIQVRMLRQSDKKYVRLETRAINLSDDPDVGGIVVTFRDITDHQKALTKLEHSEQRLELVLQGARLGFWDWDLSRDVIMIDERFARIIGREGAFSGLPGSQLLETIHPKDFADLRPNLQAHLEGKTAHFESEHRTTLANREYKWVNVRGMVMERDAEGKPLRMTGTILDVDERMRLAKERQELESQLQKSQKMESIGQLAGGIAHDFNNIVQVILANAGFIMNSSSDQHLVRTSAAEIEDAARRAAELTSQLLAFGRRQALSPTPCDLNELIERNLTLLRRVLPESIVVRFERSSDSSQGLVDAGQFDQVLTNLALNARDAMPAGGHLTIRTQKVHLQSEKEEEYPGTPMGDYILVTVSDTGHGILPDDQDRIFDPFFSTKHESQGSGLGLAMVDGIVRQHGGTIRVESEPEKGTTFALYWPSTSAESTEATPLEAHGAPRGTETILVVEDEAPVRRLVERILRETGYRVLTATDGDNALEMFEAHKGEIDLLLLDAIMPGANGKEVFEKIRCSHQTPVLFTSGYSASSLPANFLSQHGLEVLTKPYLPDLLLRRVRDHLDRSAPLRVLVALGDAASLPP